MFKEAVSFTKKIIEQGGRVLFVGTKPAARELVAGFASKCSMPYVNYRWLGGMLTNYKTIKQSIRRLSDLQKIKENGNTGQRTKKEILNLDRELLKLENSLGGIKSMGGLPDALFVIDANREEIAIKEANRLSIPVIGVVDTNSSPEGIDYVIPGNDDAKRAISLYLQVVSDAIIDSKLSQQATISSKYGEEFVEVDTNE